MMYTTKEIAEEMKVSMTAVSKWARRHGLEKTGRDYLFSEAQKRAFTDKGDVNRTVENGTAQLAKELDVTREAVSENARKLGYKKKVVEGREAYVFSAKQKDELRRAICR